MSTDTTTGMIESATRKPWTPLIPSRGIDGVSRTKARTPRPANDSAADVSLTRAHYPLARPTTGPGQRQCTRLLATAERAGSILTPSSRPSSTRRS